MKKALILGPCLDLGLRHPTDFPSRCVLRVWSSCLAQHLGISGLWTSTVHLPLTHYCSGPWVFFSSGHRSLRISSGQWLQCLGLIQVSVTDHPWTNCSDTFPRKGRSAAFYLDGELRSWSVSAFLFRNVPFMYLLILLAWVFTAACMILVAAYELLVVACVI